MSARRTQRDPQQPSSAAAERLGRVAQDFMLLSCETRYSYNFTWLGRPVIQYPQDLIALQQIIWSYRPEVILETGVAHGGATIFYASMLELLGATGTVIGVDVDIRAHNRRAIESHPLARRISLIQGDSAHPGTATEVRRRVQGRQRVLVVLDSNHTRDHVLAELELYSPMVRSGGHLVVLDTIVEWLPKHVIGDRPWAQGNNPMTAVAEFLQRTDRFVVDRELENTLLITAAPSGYLRCVKD